MKQITVLALLAAMALGASTFAAEDRPADKKPPAVKPGGMGMMDMDKQMAQMQEQMMQPAPAK
jgi:hypothetical protein